MTEVFGGQTVVFVTVTEDLNTRDRRNNPALIRTETPVEGCRFRPAGTIGQPAGSEKTTDVGTVVIEQWKGTCPPDPVVLSAKSRDEIKVDGVTYQLTAKPHPFCDLEGNLFKITIMAEKTDG